MRQNRRRRETLERDSPFRIELSNRVILQDQKQSIAAPQIGRDSETR